MKRLPKEIKQELSMVNQKLKENPFNAKDLRVKEMFSPLKGVYEVYLGNKGYRLVFTVELNTKKVFLKYAGERTRAIRKRWE
jgi:mRNA-degrading endonuclease RelE of RelBE toxin-antitoxin system